MLEARARPWCSIAADGDPHGCLPVPGLHLRWGRVVHAMLSSAALGAGSRTPVAAPARVAPSPAPRAIFGAAFRRAQARERGGKRVSSRGAARASPSRRSRPPRRLGASPCLACALRARRVSSALRAAFEPLRRFVARFRRSFRSSDILADSACASGSSSARAAGPPGRSRRPLSGDPRRRRARGVRGFPSDGLPSADRRCRGHSLRARCLWGACECETGQGGEQDAPSKGGWRGAGRGGDLPRRLAGFRAGHARRKRVKGAERGPGEKGDIGEGREEWEGTAGEGDTAGRCRLVSSFLIRLPIPPFPPPPPFIMLSLSLSLPLPRLV